MRVMATKRRPTLKIPINQLTEVSAPEANNLVARLRTVFLLAFTAFAVFLKYLKY